MTRQEYETPSLRPVDALAKRLLIVAATAALASDRSLQPAAGAVGLAGC